MADSHCEMSISLRMKNLINFKTLFRPHSPTSKPQTPISRIPIRTANAEKRARDLGLLQDIDETKLSPSELRALR